MRIGTLAGLRSKKRLPIANLGLGPDLLFPYGDFSQGATGWTVNGADSTHIATFANGRLRFQSDTTSPQLSINRIGVLTLDKNYEITFEIFQYVSGSIKSDSFNPVPIVSNGTNILKFRGKAINTIFGFTRNSANVDITIESITIQEIL